MRAVSFRLGDWRCDVVSDGTWWLDGGTLFGIVPRSLWEKICSPDGRNRVKVGMNTLVLRDGKRTILVETGAGNKLSEKRRARHDIGEGNLLRELEGIGVEREDVDAVVLTHLHFDHAGWNTIVDEGGRVAPTFPRARYFVQKQEWEDAMSPTAQTAAGYLEEDFVPLEEHGQLELVKGAAEVSRGVTVERTGGHTTGHQMVTVKSGGRTLIYPGDILPTTGHVTPYYITAFDLYPAETFRVKEELLGRAAREGWLVVWGHDDEHPVTGVGREEERYVIDDLRLTIDD